MINDYISVGDILYNPFLDEISEVTGFNTDKLGQKAICFRIGKKKYNAATAWVVFKYFIALTQINENAKLRFGKVNGFIKESK